MNGKDLALKGKVYVVTGAGRGIGKAIALIYGKAGAAVCCVSRTESEIDATKKEIDNMGGRGLAVRADVRDLASMEAVFKKTSDTFGGIDILVINAGVHLERCSVEDSNPEIWRTTVPDLGERGTEGAAYSSVVISEAAGVRQYVQFIGKGVIGVDAATGSFLWGYNPVANDVATLLTWLREDVLSVAGPDYATRRELFDFIVAELRSREPLCSHRIGPVVRALANQRDDLLAFASQLDRDLAVLAAEFRVSVETARAVFNVERLPRAGLLIFGYYHGVFARITEGTGVFDSLADTTDIVDDQAHGAADSCVGDSARAERADP